MIISLTDNTSCLLVLMMILMTTMIYVVDITMIIDHKHTSLLVIKQG